MAKAPGKFKFGEWLPDQPALDNPGMPEASNVLRVGQQYVPYLPMVNSGSALTGAILSALRARGSGTAGTNGNLYLGQQNGATFKIWCASGNNGGAYSDVTPTGGLLGAQIMTLAQFDENVILTGNTFVPQFAVLGLSASPPIFSKLTGAFGDAPAGVVAGVVGQFVVLGNMGSGAGYAVQWSGIGAPTDWPTPNSAQAVAEQSGEQLVDPALGNVWGISSGDQWGLVLLDGGIVRMAYDGGGTVFQFDTIFRGPGPLFPGWWIKVGQLIYFASSAGFFVTDGTQVIPIGRGKVDNYFLSHLDTTKLTSVQCGVDYKNRLIYWTLPKTADGGNPTELLAFNYEEQKWTHVFDSIRLFVRGEESVGVQVGTEVFGNNDTLGTLTGTPGTASLISQELELNPGGRALVSGFRPQVSGTSPSVTCKVGSRNSLGDAVSFTASQTPDASTGSANFLVDNRYHRAEVDITGAFVHAIGGEFDSQPTSQY